MTNRREFLQTGVSVTALPFASGLPYRDASARTAENSIPLRRAIFDDRYAEGRSFANAMRRFGIPVHALASGDVTDLWRRERDSFRRRPRAIAGLTQFGPMFAFEQLGREHRMRVVLRVEHQATADGTIAHVMTGSPETLALAEGLLQGPDWSMMMAAVLTRCCPAGSTPIERIMAMPGAAPKLAQPPSSRGDPVSESVIHYYTPHAIREGRGVPWDGPLFSWVIAPAAAVPAESRPGGSRPGGRSYGIEEL